MSLCEVGPLMAGLAACGLAGAPAMAQEIRASEAPAQWSITPTGPDCTATRTRPDETIVITISAEVDASGIGLFATNLPGLRAEQTSTEYYLEVDDGPPIYVSTRGVTREARPGYWFAFRPVALLLGYPAGFRLSVFHDGRLIHTADLTDAHGIFSFLADCAQSLTP